jgi:hypothetical protein
MFEHLLMARLVESIKDDMAGVSKLGEARLRGGWCLQEQHSVKLLWETRWLLLGRAP